MQTLKEIKKDMRKLAKTHELHSAHLACWLMAGCLAMLGLGTIASPLPNIAGYILIGTSFAPIIVGRLLLRKAGKLIEEDLQPRSWIRVNKDNFELEETKTVKGIEIKVYTSQYDIVRKVRSTVNRRSHRVFIEFDYICNEEKTKKRKYGDTTFYLGKNSRRIYAIEIEGISAWPKFIGKPNKDSTKIVFKYSIVEPKVIFKAMRKLKQEEPRKRRNYKIVKQVIKDNKRKLFR